MGYLLQKFSELLIHEMQRGYLNGDVKCNFLFGILDLVPLLL